MICSDKMIVGAKHVLLLALTALFSVWANAQSAPAQNTIETTDSSFVSLPIPDNIFARMQGKSYKANCAIPRSELRYLRLLHCDAEGNTRVGEMVCNKSIANDLIAIFKELYLNGYRIARIALVDDYDANDEKSMTANNTSCFNYRTVAGSKTLSKHSRGLAIDINPLHNPCVNLATGKVEPAAGKPYAYKRTNTTTKGIRMIDRNDLAYKLFTQHGFKWGGAWRSKKDYQHFEK